MIGERLVKRCGHSMRCRRFVYTDAGMFHHWWCGMCGETLACGAADYGHPLDLELCRAVAVDRRAAERLAEPLEYDWLVHGDCPPHAPERWPSTDEEHAALLAYWVGEGT